MREIEWFFPEGLDEVPPLLEKRGVVPHGGGTGILRTGALRVNGLIDLGRLPLRQLERLGGRVEIGAALTFAEVAESLERTHILSRALGASASTPLRNRITVGGSVALFPVWSDIMGPLIALDADVCLVGAVRGTFPLLRYVSEPALRRCTLVTGVSFRDQPWSSWYHRETRTCFDYAAFTLTVLLKKGAGKILDARIVVVGCAGKFLRLHELEGRVKGKPAGEVGGFSPGEAGALSFPSLPFNRKKYTSPEYLAHCARVELERGLAALMGEDR